MLARAATPIQICVEAMEFGIKASDLAERVAGFGSAVDEVTRCLASADTESCRITNGVAVPGVRLAEVEKQPASASARCCITVTGVEQSHATHC
jgi:hypothetical protein